MITKELSNPNIIALSINKGTEDINNSPSLAFLKELVGFDKTKIIPIMTHLDKIDKSLSFIKKRYNK